MGVSLYSVSNFFLLSSRQLRVSGFTRSPETIEWGTKRETATHFALLVASRCNTTTLTFGSRPQHQNININVSCVVARKQRRRLYSDLQAGKQPQINQLQTFMRKMWIYAVLEWTVGHLCGEKLVNRIFWTRLCTSHRVIWLIVQPGVVTFQANDD